MLYYIQRFGVASLLSSRNPERGIIRNANLRRTLLAGFNAPIDIIVSVRFRIVTLCLQPVFYEYRKI